MKKNEKLLIAVLVTITLVVIIFAGMKKKGDSTQNIVDNTGDVANFEDPVRENYGTVGEDGSKVNTSEALKANKVVNNIEFSDIQLSERDGTTLLTAELKNNGEQANDIFSVKVTLLDDAGQDIVTVKGVVPPVQVGTTAMFEVSMTLDYANAYDFRVELEE